MVLDFLKRLKETSFCERKRNYYKNMNFYTNGKFLLRRNKESMNFWG